MFHVEHLIFVTLEKLFITWNCSTWNNPTGTVCLSRMFHVEHSKENGSRYDPEPVLSVKIKYLLSVIDVSELSVLLDEFLTGFNLVAHEKVKCLVSFLSILKCDS